MRASSVTAAVVAALALEGCRTAEVRQAAAPAPWEVENPVRPLPRPPLGIAADYAKAAVEVTPEKVRLGRWLFFDPRLSADGTVSCATCHRPENAFSEPTPHSTGVGGRQGTRKSPPIVNAAFAVREAYFWDGRAASLVDQAKGPIENPLEMANTHANVERTLDGIAGYRKAFREVYGGGPVDIARVADAIAAYETTLFSGASAWDRYQAGDAGALSAKAKQGREVFFGRGHCDACHAGPGFTDSAFHNIGVGWRRPAEGRPDAEGFADPGRYAVTRRAEDVGAFRTPTLRDLSRRAPYMHDGSEPMLEGALLRYVQFDETPHLDASMKQIHLMPCDVAPLVAFLAALEGTVSQEPGPTSFPQ